MGYVEKIPAAGGEHAIIRQRRIETAMTVIITTAFAQRNNPGDAIGKYPGGCSLGQRKPTDQRSLHRSLSARRERPGCGRAAEQRDELAPWITSSAGYRS